MLFNTPAESILLVYMFRAFYQSAQFINWPVQSRNYRLGAQFINRVRNLEIESRASNERSVQSCAVHRIMSLVFTFNSWI